MSMFRNRLITTIILISGLYLTFTISKSTYTLWQKAERVKEAQKKMVEAEKRNEELRQKLEFSQSPEFVEREARDKLGLVKPGETVVIIPPFEASQAAVVENLPNWKKWLKLFF